MKWSSRGEVCLEKQKFQNKFCKKKKDLKWLGFLPINERKEEKNKRFGKLDL